MLLGIPFLCCTGILWVILGAVISRAARQNGNISFIQGGSAMLTVLVCLPWIILSKSNLPLIIVFLLPVSGAINFFTFELMNRAMKIGPNGMVWAMIQCAFVMPFLMGIFIFNVPCPWTRSLGIVLLLTAMLLMGISGKKNNNSGNNSFKWLFFTIAAFFLAGITQCCANLPSYLITDTDMDNAMRIFRGGLSTCGVTGVWLICGCFNRKAFDYRNSIGGMLVMTVSSLIATLSLYAGLDLMVKANAGAIGYPVTMGVTIAFFQVYTAISLKERITPLSAASIILCLTSIVFISL